MITVSSSFLVRGRDLGKGATAFLSQLFKNAQGAMVLSTHFLEGSNFQKDDHAVPNRYHKYPSTTMLVPCHASTTTTVLCADPSPGQIEEGQKLQFPWKLHQVLNDADIKGYSAIISWMPDGGSFKVHSKARFAAEIMSVYFESTKFKSFQRSLNLWGFRTVPKGILKGHCTNPFLIRGRPELCIRMNRVRVRGVFIRAAPPVSSQELSKNKKRHSSAPSTSTAEQKDKATTVTPSPLLEAIFRSTPRNLFGNNNNNINNNGGEFQQSFSNPSALQGLLAPLPHHHSSSLLPYPTSRMMLPGIAHSTSTNAVVLLSTLVAQKRQQLLSQMARDLASLSTLPTVGAVGTMLPKNSR